MNKRIFGITVAVFFLSILTATGQNCLHFDGNNDLVHINDDNNALDLSNSGTMEAWVYFDHFEDYAGIIHRGDDDNFSDESYTLQMAGSYFSEPASKVLFALVENGSSNEILISNMELELNRWYHLAATWNSSEMKLYINGRLDASTTYSINVAQTNGGINIGTQCYDKPGSYNFHGNIDEVRLWSSTRTQTQIVNNMFSELTSPSTESDLVFNLRMNESSGASADNAEGTSGLDGALTNMDGTTDWVSNASPIRTASIFEDGDQDISETSTCWVDINMSTEMDTNYYGVFQINEIPATTSGLGGFLPACHWELWAADTDFDGTFSSTVKFHYDDIYSIKDESQLKLYRRDSRDASSWTEVLSYSVNNEGDNTDGNGYVEVTLDQGSSGGFSGQYILSGENVDQEPFPVELLYFEARNNNASVTVNWATASQIHHHHFEVLRKNEDANYELLDIVSGPENSNEILEYTILDNSPESGINYYILKQVDVDGTFTFYGPVAVSFTVEQKLSIYPNPTSDKINIILTDYSSVECITLRNIQGDIVMTISPTEIENNGISVGHLPSGLYLMSIKYEGQMINKKILVQ